MAALTAAIRVNYRFIDGYHVYTSDDVYGLYVANRDPARAYAAVAPSLEKLIQLNEAIACRVEPVLTFSELVRSARNPDQPILHEITSRSFVARAAQGRRRDMAMRRFSREEFWRELERRGCHRVTEEDDLGSFWLAPDGRHFQVPPPDADDRYPDWMLDDLIRQHGLPQAVRPQRRSGRNSGRNTDREGSR